MVMNFVGVGSGLELSKMLTQLEAAERMRLNPITLKKKAIDAKISGFGKLKTTLSKFGDAANKLRLADSLQSRTVTGHDKYFNVSATSEAATGNYTIKIDELAVCHSLVSSAVTDTTAALGHIKASRKMIIEQENGQKLEITVDEGEVSLESIASAINRAVSKNEKGNALPSTLNAAVVYDQLLITCKDTGEESTIKSIYPSAEADKGMETIVIKQANGHKLEITLDNNGTSLESIARAINRAVSKDEKGNALPSTLNAAIVRASDDNYQLVITSQESGEKNAITSISSSDSTLNRFFCFNSRVPAESAMKEVAKAKDAKFTFNNIEITSASNVIKNTVPGVNIALNDVMPLAKTFTVSADNKKAKETVQAWIEAFNELQSTMASLAAFTPPASGTDKKNKPCAPLISDATLREIDNSIRAIFSHGQVGKFSVLSQIGINMDEKGKLIVEDKQLDKALSDNAPDVARLFSGPDDKTGIANEICLAVKNYVENKGTLDNTTNNLRSTLKSLQNSYDRTEESIERTLTRYRTQFTNLDRFVSSLNNTSHYLATQFSAMIKST